jgi:lipopolysaccharide export system permease protein
MRLFRTALLREMTATGTVTLFALSAILLVTQVVRILGRAATGDILGAAVPPILAFTYVNSLPMLLSLSVFMAIFLTLTRYWQDSEMVIWATAGVTPRNWIDSVLRFALPFSLIIALLSLLLLPWAAQKRAEFEQSMSIRQEVTTFTPGVFMESPSQNRVTFLEGLDPDKLTARNIFIQSTQQQRSGIVVAQTGQLRHTADGHRYLELGDGRRYEGMPGRPDYRLLEFERYSFLLSPGQAGELARRPKQTDTLTLLKDPVARYQGEIFLRIGHPISVLILALLAIPLSHFNPRGGRSLNALLAILTYATYNNLMGMGESWVTQDKLGALSASALIHGGALGLVLFLFWLRQGRRAPKPA